MLKMNKDNISLIVVGFLTLFLELTLIRWLPSNILSLWYFSNIVLISSFLGIGIGSMMSSKFKDLFKWFPIALLTFVSMVLLLRLFEVILPSDSPEWMWNYYYRGNTFSSSVFNIGVYWTLSIVFISNTILFAFIGQKIGILMSKFKPEYAYGLDLAGAILGVIFFSALVFSGGVLGSPVIWFLVIGVAVLWLLRESGDKLAKASVCLVIVVCLIGVSAKDEIWSPYYSIKTKESDNKSLLIYVNQFFFQEALDFDENKIVKWKYLLPYHFSNPKNVLVLGSGSGNDVATANSVGVPKIDAVEIDPVIVDLGKKYHPHNPYSNPNVKVYIDDARSFLNKSEEKYDMIILGTLDSHALLSARSTVRLDNFIYTLDSLVEVKNHLSDTGLAVLQFSAPNEEFGARLLKIASKAFSDIPIVAYWGNNNLFNLAVIAGPGLTEKAIESLDTNLFVRLDIPKVKNISNLPTDDWPYLYLSERSIPEHYLIAIGILLLISIVSIFVLIPKRKVILSPASANFFLLGAAFLLLETKSITSLSLLFGSTWVVNSFVFGSILVMLFLANLILIKGEIKHIRMVYFALGITLVLNYLVPGSYFLGLGYWIGSICASMLTALPIFFSALVFSYHFKRVISENISLMYGMNLAGAVFGGFLEYGSMLLGLRMLYILAGILYLVSFLILMYSDKSNAN